MNEHMCSLKIVLVLFRSLILHVLVSIDVDTLFEINKALSLPLPAIVQNFQVADKAGLLSSSIEFETDVDVQQLKWQLIN